MLGIFIGVARRLSVTRWSPRSDRVVKARRFAKHICCGVRLYVERLEERCVPSTLYTVNSLADVDPGGTGTSGTLRHVINLANTNHTGTAASPDLIQFATGGGTISVNSVNGGPLGLASNEVAV